MIMMTQAQSWRVYATSLGFMLAYCVPAIPALSAWLGNVTQHPNLCTLFPLAIAFPLTPILVAIFPASIPSIPEALMKTKGWLFYSRCLLWFALPLQLSMLYVTLQYWNLEQFNIWGHLAYFLSVGVYSGMFAITVGHELIHHPQPIDRILGGIMLSTVGFGSFKIVHLRIHHRYVATPLDFATAQRGQSIYAFWWKSLICNLTEAIRCEREDLTRDNKPFWQSELLLWSLCSLLWFSLAILLAGWQGGVFWSIQAIIAILKLDWTNYLQHYGLTRQQEGNDRYEPVKAHHAWSDGLGIYSLAFFNLLRHSDHHVNPHRNYQSLRLNETMPTYPYCYTIMYILTLVPAVFQQVVHPRLDLLSSQSQQEA